MEKTDFIFVMVGILIIILALVFGSHKFNAGEAIKQKSTSLSDLQVQACTTADKYRTCDSRLPEVGIVLKEECCSQLRKCCI